MSPSRPHTGLRAPPRHHLCGRPRRGPGGPRAFPEQVGAAVPGGGALAGGGGGGIAHFPSLAAGDVEELAHHQLGSSGCTRGLGGAPRARAAFRMPSRRRCCCGGWWPAAPCGCGESLGGGPLRPTWPSARPSPLTPQPEAATMHSAHPGDVPIPTTFRRWPPDFLGVCHRRLAHQKGPGAAKVASARRPLKAICWILKQRQSLAEVSRRMTIKG